MQIPPEGRSFLVDVKLPIADQPSRVLPQPLYWCISYMETREASPCGPRLQFQPKLSQRGVPHSILSDTCVHSEQKGFPQRCSLTPISTAEWTPCTISLCRGLSQASAFSPAGATSAGFSSADPASVLAPEADPDSSFAAAACLRAAARALTAAWVCLGNGPHLGLSRNASALSVTAGASSFSAVSRLPTGSCMPSHSTYFGLDPGNSNKHSTCHIEEWTLLSNELFKLPVVAHLVRTSPVTAVAHAKSLLRELTVTLLHLEIRQAGSCACSTSNGVPSLILGKGVGLSEAVLPAAGQAGSPELDPAHTSPNLSTALCWSRQPCSQALTGCHTQTGAAAERGRATGSQSA